MNEIIHRMCVVSDDAHRLSPPGKMFVHATRNRCTEAEEASAVETAFLRMFVIKSFHVWVLNCNTHLEYQECGDDSQPCPQCRQPSMMVILRADGIFSNVWCRGIRNCQFGIESIYRNVAMEQASHRIFPCRGRVVPYHFERPFPKTHRISL